MAAFRLLGVLLTVWAIYVLVRMQVWQHWQGSVHSDVVVRVDPFVWYLWVWALVVGVALALNGVKRWVFGWRSDNVSVRHATRDPVLGERLRRSPSLLMVTLGTLFMLSGMGATDSSAGFRVWAGFLVATVGARWMFFWRARHWDS
jgi:hypothetical protein